MKKMTDQQLADFHKRNIYIYLLKDGSQIASFFEYKKGDLYGGKREIEKLVKTFSPNK